MAKIIEVLSERCQPSDNKFKNVTFVNPYSYLIARKNVALFTQFDEIHFDGILLSVIFKAVGVSNVRKSFDMTSIAHDVFLELSQNGEGVYLIGGEPGVADVAVSKLRGEYKNLNILGVRDGFFTSSSDRDDFLEYVKNKSPRVVITSMGTPYQEKFLNDLRIKGWKGTGYTCGGFFHQTAKLGVSYYPEWINKYHLRWAFRIYDEPKLIERYLIKYPMFFVFFMVDYVRSRLGL